MVSRVCYVTYICVVPLRAIKLPKFESTKSKKVYIFRLASLVNNPFSIKIYLLDLILSQVHIQDAFVNLHTCRFGNLHSYSRCWTNPTRQSSSSPSPSPSTPTSSPSPKRKLKLIIFSDFIFKLSISISKRCRIFGKT